jgi:hypothetical protein
LIERESVKSLWRVADVPLAVAVGFGIALCALVVFVSRARLMPLGLGRIVAVQQRLATGAGPVGGVAVLGSSVVLEGVDCAQLATRLPDGTRCDNLAWTGGSPRQWLLVEPALRRSPARVLVLGLDPFALLHPIPIPDDRLAVAGWWEFVPEDERASLRGLLSDDELAALDASHVRQLLRFRSFPLDIVNERVREVARKDLRYDGYLQNFTAPWLRLGAAPPAALERHLEQLTGVMTKGGPARFEESERVLERLVEKARSGAPRTSIFFVLTPMHPRLQQVAGDSLQEIRTRLAALSERLGASFADDTLALSAAQFADAVHPSAAGRSAWSRMLGERAAPLLAN